MKKGNLYYLASPYSHDNKLIEILRYEIVGYAATKLINKGHMLIEPISMCAEKSKKYNLEGGYKFWKKRDRTLISKCDGILVLMLPGWDTSEGVTDEINYAYKQGLTIEYIEPSDLIEIEAFNVLGNYGGNNNAIYKE